jgi:hypothetical protein
VNQPDRKTAAQVFELGPVFCTITYLAKADIVVELHPFAVSDGAARQAALLDRLSATHTVQLIKATPRNWAGIAEIEALHDIERALVTTEGRKSLGSWLVASPKQG